MKTYAELKTSGTCVLCKKRASTNDKVYCDDCSEYRRAYRQRVYHKTYQANRRKARREAGLCPMCGAVKEKGVPCGVCDVRHEQWRAQRVSQGLCRSCGKERGDSGTSSRCRACLNTETVNQLNRRQKLIAQGLCWKCEVPVLGGATCCAECKAGNLQRVAQHYAERKAQGLCRRCLAPISTKSTIHCERHRAQQAEYAKARYRSRKGRNEALSEQARDAGTSAIS